MGNVSADLGVVSLIPAQFHTFVEIDQEIISTAIFSLPLIQERVVVSYKRKYVKVLVNHLVKLAQESKGGMYKSCHLSYFVSEFHL